MSSASVEVKSFTCLRPIEHHHFHLRGRWLLFDVNGLRVVPSDAMDGVILRLASQASIGAS